MMKKPGFLETFGYTVLASALMIILGLVYFMINLWIVKVGSGFLEYTPSADWAVIAASLMTIGGVEGTATRKH